jgi:hypothetical protein
MSTAPVEDSSFLGLEGLHVFVTGAAGESHTPSWRVMLTTDCDIRWDWGCSCSRILECVKSVQTLLSQM